MSSLHPFTRRKLLRNIAALSAVQSLPALALLGCKSSADQPAPTPSPIRPMTPHPAAGPGFRLLFEGPWLFSSAGNGKLLATAVIDAGHKCVLGKWSNNSLVSPIPGHTGTLQLNSGDRWTGSLATPVMNSFAKVVGGGFASAGGVFLDTPNFAVTPDPTDLCVTVPVPDQVLLGGYIPSAQVLDASGKPTAYKFYISAIFKYLQPAQGQPPVLALTDGKPKPQVVPVNPSDDLIFRLQHIPCFGQESDPDHVKHAFVDLQSRISTGKPDLTVALTSTVFTPNVMPDGISDLELGLATGADLPCPKFHANYTDFANCAGGPVGGGNNGN